jgi:hypothetical protein
MSAALLATAILAAFSGVDDGLPVQATVLCPPAVLLDGMPVTFREEIDQRTLWPWDFDVITRGGVHHPPLCATTAPANQESEDRTVLLIGQLGESTTDPPARVVVTGNLLTESGQNLRGASAPVIPLSAGPELVYAEPAPAEPENFTYPPLTLPVNGLLIRPTACPAGTVQRVRATWDGGVVAPSGAEAGDAQRSAYAVQMADGRNVTPAAIADLGDMDNNHLLCLDTTGTPIRVSAAAGLFRDPNGDLNPATSVALSPG